MKTPLEQNGDFRSPECIEALKEADIVVTNPPFSLFREYVAQLIEYGKQFIIVGRQIAITYKDIYPLLHADKMRLGYNYGTMEFVVPPDSEPRANRYREENGTKYISLGDICWFTNVDVSKRCKEIIINVPYIHEAYPHYDNYDGIDVRRLEWVPADYWGVMGVPITYMYNHNPEQFEIVRFRKGDDGKDLSVNGKVLFFRILIRRKR